MPHQEKGQRFVGGSWSSAIKVCIALLALGMTLASPIIVASRGGLGMLYCVVGGLAMGYCLGGHDKHGRAVGCATGLAIGVLVSVAFG